MQTEAERAAAALEAVQDGFRANGAELIVDRVGGGVAHVRLAFMADACLDCILDGELLEGIILQTLRTDIPSITSVELLDPRKEKVASAAHARP